MCYVVSRATEKQSDTDGNNKIPNFHFSSILCKEKRLGTSVSLVYNILKKSVLNYTELRGNTEGLVYIPTQNNV